MQESLSSDKIELFETMEMKKAVVKLALPTVVGCLVMVFYNLADTYFVGLINDPIETTAVTLVAPVILLFNAVNNLFGVGTASLMSRALGSRDYETVKKTSAFGFYAALGSGLIFSLLALIFHTPLLGILGSQASDHDATYAYMTWTVFFGAAPAILNVVMANMVRAEGSAMHATLGTVSGCILNIILDPFFILPWGLNMKAAGAGLATFIANCVACMYYLVYMRLKKNTTFVTISPKYLKPDMKVVKEVCSVGVPAAIQNILNVTGMTILNNLCSKYGAEAVSAVGIAHKLALIPMYFSMGIGQGIMPLIGYNYAADNKKRIRQALKTTISISAVIILVLLLVFLLNPEAIMRSFMENELVVEYGAAFLKGMIMATPFFALDFLAVGVFQACGLGKYAFYFAIARKVVLEIPAMLILDHIFPMYGLAYAQLCAEIVLGCIAVLLIKKIVSDK